MFLLNSRLGRFSAARFGSEARSSLTYHGHPFSRSYGVILPSSFSMDHSSTLGFSPRLPVSVCGTVGCETPTRGFSWRPASRTLCGATGAPSASALTYNRWDLPHQSRYRVASAFHGPTVPLLPRPPLWSNASTPGTGIFTRFPSPTPLGLGLGAGSPGADDPGSGTLRLSVWGILPPILAYSFRHLHFPALHRPSRIDFSALGTLPYHAGLHRRPWLRWHAS